MMLWYEKTGAADDVIVSTRVRLARNLSEYPFENHVSEEKSREIIEKVKSALPETAGYRFYDVGGMSGEKKLSLCQQNIISRALSEKKSPCALLINEDKQLYVMVMEEDHVRIQCIKTGLDLEGALEGCTAADTELEKACEIAFSERLGYLTHCPTNLGTGMRASVMMFLPATTMFSRIGALQGQLAKIGLTIRGMSGEGSRADGYLYQISNQVTLGLTEKETIDKLSALISQIAENERKLRDSIKGAELERLRDRVMRSYGVMKYASLVSTQELFSLYSDVRLGAAVGIIKDVDMSKLDRVLIEGMPAVLTEKYQGRITDTMSRDKIRAELVRSAV